MNKLIRKKILSLVKDINDHVDQLFSDKKVFFREGHLSIPVHGSGELIFYKSISWLHGLFNERGLQNIRYISTKLSVKGDTGYDFLKEVILIRTYLSHDLDLKKARDRDKFFTVQALFEKTTGKVEPTLDDWDKLNEYLFDLAQEYLMKIKFYLSELNEDPSKDVIIQEWNHYIQDKVPLERVKEIFRKVSKNLGLDYFDVSLVSQRSYDQWMSKLAKHYYEDYSDMEGELKRIIESSLVKTDMLPISGNDIIEHCGVLEGKVVGDKLKLAREIFSKSPCDKESLLDQIC